MRLIKLNKNQDISEAIQMVRNLKDDEVVFELVKGSPVLANSTNLKLLKKTGEALGKRVLVRTDDPTGRVLAMKADILEPMDRGTLKPARELGVPKVKRSDVKPRFSDILVPRKAPMKQTAARSLERPAEKPEQSSYLKSQQKFLSTNPKPKRSLRPSFSKIFVITMVVLVMVVFGLAVLLPQATITVYARSEPISRDTEISIDKSATAVDSSKLLIPAVPVSQEVTQTKNFPTTGTKQIGTNATGSVTIYNFTKNTLTLKAATTTLVANGKKFVFVKDATNIRPTARIGTGTDEAIDPTSLTPPVPVTAVDIGADSNLPAGTKFAIQNAALGNTQNVIAANDLAFTGGTSHSVQVMSQQDMDKAIASLTNSISVQAQSDLNSQNSSGDLQLLPQAVTQQVLAKTANKNVGDQTDNFDMTMIAKVSGLAFHQSDAKNLILQQIQSVLSSDKYLLPDAAQKLNATFKSIDLTKGVGVLSVHFETTAAYKVSENDMTKQLAGKTATQIKEILLAKPEIDRVDVEFSPFFVNKAPKFNGKIYVHTMLSQGS